ncbi:MAG: hypothetical protein ISQ06_00550 [Planctomycetaceae bacterium]|jgi:hypothetical protein|nr:hypothetical protein [Planctomycetaceae bacterium]
MTDATQTSDRLRQLIPILGFNLAYLLAAIVGSVASGNSEFILYIVIMLILGSVVWFADRRVGFSPLVLWGLSGWGLIHMAGGLIAVRDSWPINGEHRVLYSLWLIPDLLKYDHVVHAFGFGVTTLVCWEGLCAILTAQKTVGDPSMPVPTLGMLTLCGAASMGFGGLNEVIEFAITLTLPETNIGGYINTGWDLVSNLVGVIVACLLIAWRHGESKQE